MRVIGLDAKVKAISGTPFIEAAWLLTFIPGFNQICSSLESYNRKTQPQPPKVNAIGSSSLYNNVAKYL